MSIRSVENPIQAIREFLPSAVNPAFEERLPFTGGTVGYFSYELGRLFEPRAATRSIETPFPYAALAVYDTALLIDENGNALIVQSDITGDICGMRNRKKSLIEAVRDAAPSVSASTDGIISETAARKLDWARVQCNVTFQEYISKVDAVKEYIAAGDVYQVNLSRRLQTESGVSSETLFASLQKSNPAPFSCFLPYPEFSIISGSPELFLAYNTEKNVIETRPIKGTLPRGENTEADEHLAQKLLQSEKDRAENVMIVDMLRNDLGRISEYGSVTVPKLFDIERHPSVFQMVSTIEANVRGGVDAADILQATFPGGSITGAPKIRAMQIIEELEPDIRGPYTGCAGFFDVRGDIMLNILIRTIVLKDGTASFHAGGGIVADSVPELEFRETEYKAAGLLKAICDAEK